MKKVLYVVPFRLKSTDVSTISNYCQKNGKVIEFVDEQPLDKKLYEVIYQDNVPVSFR